LLGKGLRSSLKREKLSPSTGMLDGCGSPGTTGVMPKRFCSSNGKWEGVMRYQMFASAAFATAAFMLQSTDAKAEDYFATFSGFEEIGALNNETGAIFSPGQGTLALSLNTTAGTLNFTLSYSSLSIGGTVTQSHIHFGKEHVPGGVMVFFCSNLSSAPMGTQACPTLGGTVSGTITGSNVLALAGQHVSAGDFGALVAALQSNTAYGNIHTTLFPSGEIRGQILQGSLNQQNPPPR
jgi:CHRD domain